METRNIICQKCDEILGTDELPNGTSEQIWEQALRGYQCSQDPTDLGVERLDTNDLTQASTWMDCKHHNNLDFRIVATVGSGREVGTNDSHVIAVEHSSDGVNVDGEVTTKSGVGIVQGIDINIYNYGCFSQCMCSTTYFWRTNDYSGGRWISTGSV